MCIRDSVVAELHVEAIILAVLLVLTEGTLIGFKAHPALHPHSGGQARLVSNANPKSAERRAPSNRGPRIVPGVQATSGEQRTGQFMSRREARLAREAQAKNGKEQTGGSTAARIVGETPKRPRKKKH